MHDASWALFAGRREKCGRDQECQSELCQEEGYESGHKRSSCGLDIRQGRPRRALRQLLVTFKFEVAHVQPRSLPLCVCCYHNACCYLHWTASVPVMAACRSFKSACLPVDSDSAENPYSKFRPCELEKLIKLSSECCRVLCFNRQSSLFHLPGANHRLLEAEAVSSKAGVSS